MDSQKGAIHNILHTQKIFSKMTYHQQIGFVDERSDLKIPKTNKCYHIVFEKLKIQSCKKITCVRPITP